MTLKMHRFYKKENKRRDKSFNSQLLIMNGNIRNQYKTKLKSKIEQQTEWNDNQNSITWTGSQSHNWVS